MLKKNIKKTFLFFTILFILLVSWISISQKMEKSTETYFENKNPANLNIKMVETENSKLFLNIENKGEENYYVEEINLEKCEKINGVISLDPKKTKIIPLNCSKSSNKKIEIFYKKEGNSEILYYESFIKNN
jgi:hypothetical protein